eukprot:1176811-Prorocentrum_minimum.AAC.3
MVDVKGNSVDGESASGRCGERTQGEHKRLKGSVGKLRGERPHLKALHVEVPVRHLLARGVRRKGVHGDQLRQPHPVEGVAVEELLDDPLVALPMGGAHQQRVQRVHAQHGVQRLHRGDGFRAWRGGVWWGSIGQVSTPASLRTRLKVVNTREVFKGVWSGSEGKGAGRAIMQTRNERVDRRWNVAGGEQDCNEGVVDLALLRFSRGALAWLRVLQAARRTATRGWAVRRTDTRGWESLWELELSTRKTTGSRVGSTSGIASLSSAILLSRALNCAAWMVGSLKAFSTSTVSCSRCFLAAAFGCVWSCGGLHPPQSNVNVERNIHRYIASTFCAAPAFPY